MTASEIIQKTRLFPSTFPPQPLRYPLSILDALCARFSCTGAIWVFEATTKEKHTDELVSRLRSSLLVTLDLFPHWAGQLQWASFRAGGGYSDRLHRPMVVYGSPSDPGVEWVVTRQTITAESLVSSTYERESGVGIWIDKDFPQTSLISDTPLALQNLSTYEGLPSISIQINLLACGGYAISARIAHSLADAQTLVGFMHHWAATSRALHGQSSRFPIDPPVFDPERLNISAAGDINASAADPTITAVARSLPLHRFDWWMTSAPGYPQVIASSIETSKPSTDQLSTAKLSPSTPGPWETWDLALPVTHAQLYFSPTQLANIQAAARKSPSADKTVSKLDSLLAHVWHLINVARGQFTTNDTVYLDITIGARTRVSPPLPASFVGSPIFIAHVSSPVSTITSSDIDALSKTATSIRETISQFTPEKVGALLHDVAHEVVPNRLWQAFLGKNHVLVTSWLRLGVYDVDFEGTGRKPRFVHAIMPKMDGCLQIMEPGGDDGGTIASVYLEEKAMERLLFLQGNSVERFRSMEIKG